jgi:hypothetical protein
MAWSEIKRRVFVSHYRGDRTEVDNFIDYFANQLGIFTPYVLGANENDDFIDSDNPEYVMTRIRELYLKDTTVTIVLVGSCTHSRRYIDWELKSSLRQSDNYIANGVMGVILPSQGSSANLPPRLEANWEKGHENCYARYWIYPRSGNELGEWIDDAYSARSTRNHLIKNSQTMMKYNRSCNVHNVTH